MFAQEHVACFLLTGYLGEKKAIYFWGLFVTELVPLCSLVAFETFIGQREEHGIPLTNGIS